MITVGSILEANRHGIAVIDGLYGMYEKILIYKNHYIMRDDIVSRYVDTNLLVMHDDFN